MNVFLFTFQILICESSILFGNGRGLHAKQYFAKSNIENLYVSLGSGLKSTISKSIVSLKKVACKLLIFESNSNKVSIPANYALQHYNFFSPDEILRLNNLSDFKF